MSQQPHNENYLGDGVYASFDGYQIRLSTLQGMVIYIDPTVYESLKLYVAMLEKSGDQPSPNI